MARVSDVNTHGFPKMCNAPSHFSRRVHASPLVLTLGHLASNVHLNPLIPQILEYSLY
jgi:hypothetical protein